MSLKSYKFSTLKSIFLSLLFSCLFLVLTSFIEDDLKTKINVNENAEEYIDLRLSVGNQGGYPLDLCERSSFADVFEAKIKSGYCNSIPKEEDAMWRGTNDDCDGLVYDENSEVTSVPPNLEAESISSGCCNGTHSNGAGGHNHVKSLNLLYIGTSGNVNLYTNDGSGGTGITNITQLVQNGDTVVFAALGSQKYGSNSDWTYPGGSVDLHTSCSQNDVVLGTTFGPFEILGITIADDCSEGSFNPPSPPTPNPSCNCQAGIYSVTFIYNGSSGIGGGAYDYHDNELGYWSTLVPGQSYSFDISNTNHTHWHEHNDPIFWTYQNGGWVNHGTMDSSCGTEVLGNSYGPFTIAGWTDLQGNQCTTNQVCDNVTDGGLISGEETNCDPFNPMTIVNVEEASGNSNPGSGNNGGGNSGIGCCNGTHSNGAGGHNHVKSLNLLYTGTTGNVNLYTNDGSGGTGVTNITQFVQNGGTVIFAAAGSQKYGSNSDWTYPGGSVGLHTSCSQAEVVIGATFGPFQILGITTANGCTEGEFEPPSEPIEYQWIKSTTGCPNDISQAILNATGLTYNPPFITETTWYVRLVRRELCEENGVGDPQGWIPSNCVVKIVEPCGAPIFTYIPADITIECTEDESSANTGIATGTDTCGSVTITETDAVADACGSTKIITRTWIATGDCGSQSSAAQIITVVDTASPIITVPVDITIECTEDESSANTGIATGADTCGSVTITEVDAVVDACGNTKTITRTWTATDNCENTDIGVQVITVQDTTEPILVGVPIAVTVECDAIPAPATLTATDNCDVDVEITFEEVRTDGNCADNYTLTRTWTATDNCGNTDIGVQVITVQDTTAPVLVGVPIAVTVECDAVPTPATPTATDNCDIDIEILFLENITPGACIDNYIITRSWTATDNCGNKTIGVQVIIVEDTTDPVISGVPGNITGECNALPAPAQPTATDNCDTDVTIDYTEVKMGGDCLDAYILTRTWIATDNCGNTDIQVQVIEVEDTTGPILSGVPADLTVECNNISSPANPTATDNCDIDVDLDFNEVSVANGCGYILTRTWIATDNCGNSVDATQTITVNSDAPVLSDTPEDLTVECNNVPAAANVTGSSDCDSNIVIWFTENIITGSCADSYTIERIWTIDLACGGNDISHTQIITVDDTQSPILAGVPADLNVACGNVPSPVNPVATDNCDTDVYITFSEDQTPLSCGYELTRTWTAVDNCGNETSASQIITVEDNDDPVLNGIPADVIADCNNIPPAAANITVTDNCSLNVTIDFAETITSGTCTNAYILTRTWTATDDCGNIISAAQNISVEDNTPPTLIDAPANITVECSSIPGAPYVGATDNCDYEVEAILSEVETLLACGYLITRTWIATDDCGNESSVTQEVTVADSTPPSLWEIPADLTVECGNIPAIDPGVGVLDNCDPDATLDFTESYIVGSCADNYIIVRTWTAADNCGNTISDFQNITVQDIQAPDLTGIPTDLTVDCNNVPTPAQPVATDNCNPSVDVNFDEVSVADGCGYILTRTWTAIDNCGNTTEAVQTIFVQDITNPTLIGVLSNLTIDLTQGQTIPTAPILIGTDNCDTDVEITFEENQTGSGCSYTLERIWTATDNCGNIISATQIIEVIGGLSVTETHADAACGENNGSIDLTVDGGVAPITFVWSNGVGNIEDQANLAPGIYEVTITDGTGCAANLSIEIIGTGELQADILATMVSCYEGNDGSINVAMVNGLAPFAYAWTGGIGNISNPTNLTADSYNVTITDANGCSVFTGANVNQPQELIITIDSDGGGCAGELGSATANVNGGTTPYQYAWSTGVTTATINDLAVGTYTITITDDNGCTIEDEVTINTSSNLIVSIEKTDVSCYLDTDGTATVSVIGGQPGYTYLWSNGQTNATITNLEAGSYTVTITDGAGCIGIQTIAIISPPELQLTTVSTEVTPNGNDGTATVTATGGTLPYQYIWSNGQMIATATGLSVGNYFVTVIDDNGCFVIDQVDVNATTTTGDVNIGDYVWFDTNRDGIQDANEVGFNNVMVKLLTVGQDGTFGTLDDEVVATETTSNDPALTGAGYYLFENVTVGTYQIEFMLSSLPNDYMITLANQGMNDNLDSDANSLTGRTSTFTVVAGQMDDLSFDVGVHPECDNVNTGGTIIATQTICAGEVPDLLVNSVYPAGGGGDLEYIWLTNNTGSPFSNTDPTWTLIQGATNEFYQPGQIYSNTYFVRCARRLGCTNYTGESNIVAILVTPLPSIGIEQAPTSLCLDESTSFQAVYAGATATYLWDFGAGASTQTSTQRNVYNLTYSSTGIKTVTLTVVNMGCSISIPYEFEVTNCLNNFVFTNFLAQPEPSEIEVLLNWTTQYEVNESRYFLEYSKNGDNFQTFEMRNASGSALEYNSYQAVHTEPYYGVNYYRIKYVAANGQATYSKVEAVVFNNGTRDIYVYPNPVVDYTYVEFLTELKEEATIEVVDMKGRVLSSQIASDGFRTYRVSLTDYPAGTYLIWVRYNDYRKEIERVIKITE